MLDWLIKNPQIVLFLIIGVVALIGRAAQAKKEQEQKRTREARRTGAGPAQQAGSFDTSAMNTAEAERTRRIQEELRRKILARMEAAQPKRESAPMPRPAEAPALRPAPEAVRRYASASTAAMPPPLPAAPRPVEDESVNAFQSASEKIAELEALARNASAHKDEAFAIPSPDAASRVTDEITASLRDTHAIRRAFILREILDKPVGLR